MTETLFVFNERNYLDCQSAFRGTRNQEYYLGDYSIERGAAIEVRAEKKAVGSYSIIKLKANARQFFNRSLPHIREDATDVAVLWFVKRGRVCVSHQCGYTVANAGDFVVTKSMTPFSVECETDNESVHEVLHLVVPVHVLRRHIRYEINTGFLVPARGREFAVAERLLRDVFEDADELPEEVSQLLVDSALAVLGHAVKALHIHLPVRQTISDKRFQDVLRFIEIHLSDPKLSISAVAKGCGISARYLSFLLNVHSTSFSTLVWEKRLQMASRWLSSSKSSDVSISEVAYKVGFKSPAHFSRMFKRVFNMSPRDFRSAGCAEPERERQELFAGSTNSLQ